MRISLKSPLLMCILIFCSIHGFSQSLSLDSLQQALSTASRPLDQFEILDRILLAKVAFNATNVDSSASLQLVQIAQQLKNDSLLAISYNWIGYYFSSNKGDNTSGLEYYFKAMPHAIKAQDKRRISSLYFDIALSYSNLQNNEAAHKNNLKGGENLPDKSSPMYDFMLAQYHMNEAKYFLSVIDRERKTIAGGLAAVVLVRDQSGVDVSLGERRRGRTGK